MIPDQSGNEMNGDGLPLAQGLYDPSLERDGCGVGFLAAIDGKASHSVVRDSIEVLKNLLHRGAVGGDSMTGDGAGILIQIPDKFFRAEAERLGFSLPESRRYGVGMIFMPQSGAQSVCMRLVEEVIADEGLDCIGWREVPTDATGLGEIARKTQPLVMQVFIGGKGLSGAALDRKLLVVRKLAQRKALEELSGNGRLYVPSISCRTIVYKGLLMGGQVSSFYSEINNPAVESAAAVLHQRYSTKDRKSVV